MRLTPWPCIWSFVLVDLKNDTYEYLKSDIREQGEANDAYSGEELLQKGVYSQLLNYWDTRVIQEDEHVRNQLTIRSIQQNLTKDTPFLQYEYRVQESSILWTQISVLCLKRENGVPVSVLMAVQDVTELKEAELKNRMAMEEAYLAAKAANEAKTMFLSNMSHDMRTPMNAIIGFSTLLDRDASQPDKVREYNKKIAASGQHLLSLINNVLDMSKIESGQNALNIAEFTLKELLEELDSVIQPQVREKRQSLDVTVSDVNGECFLGDRLRLSQILLNLLSNAVKYTPEGGHIELSILGLPEISKGYAHLRFQVQDNGIGISPEFVKHIFDPFTRENNTIASGILGTGLGMTITRNLVDLMGGTISVESTQGKGSTFQVEVAARAIRALDRPDAETIPIVAMTANAFAENVQNSMEAGMNAHLSKPVDMKMRKDV